MRFYTLVVLLIIIFGCQPDATREVEEEIRTPQSRARTIVTTDGEVDDVDSFIRMLLYTNEFELEGLVYSSSQWHYAGDGKGTLFTSEMENTAERYGERTDLRWPGTDWMEKHIDQYAQVYQKLSLHSKDYPTAEALKSLIRIGNIEFEGAMDKDTEGSELIKEVLLDEEEEPVYLQIWGGTNTVARALKSIENTYKNTAVWDSIYQKVSEKAVIYTVLDQDATYSKYIQPNWPDIKVYYNSDQFWSFAYLWPRVVPDTLQTYLKGDWYQENILEGHRPLLADYYTWGDGRQISGDPEHTFGKMEEVKKYNRTQYDFISEGDSPAYFFLLDVGLRSMEDPAYGGWGGRMVQSEENPRRWEDGAQVRDYNPYTDTLDTTFPQTRWIAALQNDFAARADWCVQTYEEANHVPLVKLGHAADLSAAPGASVALKGSAQDPDDDTLNFHWWQYQEAGTYQGSIELKSASQREASFVVPSDAQVGETIHIILEVSDEGSPSLTRYQRVILTVA